MKAKDTDNLIEVFSELYGAQMQIKGEASMVLVRLNTVQGNSVAVETLRRICSPLLLTWLLVIFSYRRNIHTDKLVLLGIAEVRRILNELAEGQLVNIAKELDMV